MLHQGLWLQFHGCNWNWKMTASWQESYDKPRQCVKEQRHHFADKGAYSQDYGLSSTHVWRWELDNKEGREAQNWCFWTVVLEKTLLRVPWTARRPTQSILKEINPYSLEELMLKLKLQYFDHLIRRANSLEKTLMLGKIEGRRRGQQRLDNITDSMNKNLGKLWEMDRGREAWQAAVHGVGKSQISLGNWTTMGKQHRASRLGCQLDLLQPQGQQAEEQVQPI